jgi:hypothetical protein
LSFRRVTYASLAQRENDARQRQRFAFTRVLYFLHRFHPTWLISFLYFVASRQPGTWLIQWSVFSVARAAGF